MPGLSHWEVVRRGSLRPHFTDEEAQSREVKRLTPSDSGRASASRATSLKEHQALTYGMSSCPSAGRAGKQGRDLSQQPWPSHPLWARWKLHSPFLFCDWMGKVGQPCPLFPPLTVSLYPPGGLCSPIPGIPCSPLALESLPFCFSPQACPGLPITSLIQPDGMNVFQPMPPPTRPCTPGVSVQPALTSLTGASKWISGY